MPPRVDNSVAARRARGLAKKVLPTVADASPLLNLPDELLMAIMLYLPLRVRLRFMMASHRSAAALRTLGQLWRDIDFDRDFAKVNYEHFSRTGIHDLSDERLASFLIRIDALNNTVMLSLKGLHWISGVGLRPLMGSKVLTSIDLRTHLCPHKDLVQPDSYLDKVAIKVVVSMIHHSTRNPTTHSLRKVLFHSQKIPKPANTNGHYYASSFSGGVLTAMKRLHSAARKRLAQAKTYCSADGCMQPAANVACSYCDKPLCKEHVAFLCKCCVRRACRQCKTTLFKRDVDEWKQVKCGRCHKRRFCIECGSHGNYTDHYTNRYTNHYTNHRNAMVECGCCARRVCCESPCNDVCCQRCEAPICERCDRQGRDHCDGCEEEMSGSDDWDDWNTNSSDLSGSDFAY